MKKTIVVFCCCMLFISCKVQKITLSPFVVVYKSDWVGNIPPEYIIFKTQSKVFEIYAPSISGGTIGQWNVKNDTLLLFPKYEYFIRNSELKFSEIAAQDTSVLTIPQQYIVKNNSLIDITDYSIVLPELHNTPNTRVLYKRVNKR